MEILIPTLNTVKTTSETTDYAQPSTSIEHMNPSTSATIIDLDMPNKPIPMLERL